MLSLGRVPGGRGSLTRGLQPVAAGSSPPSSPIPLIFGGITQAAVQTGSTVVGRFITPNQRGRGDGLYGTMGRGVGRGGLLPLFPGYQAHWWILPHSQPTRTQHFYSCCPVLHGDPHLYLQDLHKGWWMVSLDLKDAYLHVHAPQSLVISSVCSQELGREAHCLSMEGSSFWLSHCPQSFSQTLGSCSSTPASAGMSHVPIHRQHIPYSGVRQPGGPHS